MTDPYVDAIIASTGISREQFDPTVAEWKHMSFHMETVLADHFNVEELASAVEQLATRLARIQDIAGGADRFPRAGAVAILSSNSVPGNYERIEIHFRATVVGEPQL